MPTWMNCYAGSTGSAESANNEAKNLDLFTSSTTAGYNYDSDTIESGNGLWEARCFGRAHSYNSSDGTYSYSMYVFAKKLNGATSWGDSFKVTFYYRGNSKTNSGLTRYLNGSGETRLISSHTFTGLSGSPSGTSTIGAKVTGEEGTEVYQTIDLTKTANFNDDTWSVASKTDSSIKLSGTKIANRNYRHTRMWQYKKSSASSYTTDDTVSYVAANDGGTATHTYSGLSRNTTYNVRVQFRLRNYKPKNTSSDTESGNHTVIISGLTWSSSPTTSKSDLSGSVSLSGTNQVGETLTASVTNTNSATLAYQWSYDTNSSFGSGDGTQTVISGATSNKLTVPAAAAGNYIYCKVTFTKDDYNTLTIRKYTSEKTAKGDLSGSVSLSGTNQVGKVLTATVTNTNSATLEYQWSYDTNSSFGSGDGTQTVISGATSKTLTVPTAAYGNYVYCKVTFTKDGYNTKTIREYTSGKTAKQPFANSDTSVTISGSNQMNGTLTASVTSGSSGTISYQWWTATSSTATSGTNISGATSKTFKVTSSQIGKYIGVTATLAASPTYLGGSVKDITSGTAAEISPTVTAPTIKTSLTYAGSSLALANAGSTSHGTIYYYANTSGTAPAASNSSFSTSIPTGLPTTGGAAQTYHVWYKVVGNTGYKDVGVTKIGSVAVNPGTFTVTKVPYSGNYNGSAQKAGIKVNLAGCTVKSGSASGTYGTTDSTNTTANAEVKLGAVSITNAGNSTVYYQVTKNYYQTVTGSTTITINKIAPIVTAPTLKSAQTYTGSALAYVNAGSVTGGTMYYYGSTSSTTPTSITSTSIPTGHPTTAGAAQTYYAWYKVVGDSNHTDIAITKIGTSTTIQPGTFTVTAVPFVGTYNGSTQKAGVKVNLAGCTVKSGSTSGTYGVTDSTNTTANTEVKLGAVSRADAGNSTVYYQVTKNYYQTVTGYVAINISKAPISASVTVSGTAQYGKTLNTVVQAASGTGAQSYQWWYSTSSTATSGTNISNATNYNYVIGSGLAGKYIGCTVSFAESTNYLAGSVSDITSSTIAKATGSGSVTMSGWTYGSTVPNPVPSSSTNGTSNVSYTWYNSNKTALGSKPTSTSNAGIYYVKATFATTTDYNAYTTDYVGFVVLPSVSISVSQDYLKGDYGVPAGTVTYSLGGGVGSCTNITLSSGEVKVFNNAAIASTGSAHPNSPMGTSFTYSISYKDAANATKTLQGTATISSYPQNKAFAYTYAHKNASGSAVTGTAKDFINDGQKDKQFYLTAAEWNEMVKFLYSAAYRKNSWSNSGLSAPAEVKTGDKLTAAIYNAVLILAEKAASKTYTDVTSGSRLSAAQFNGFKDIINNSR